ncbi:MAG: Endonuclease/exonuclease/phosphatase [uncultured bacterium]|uniref:Endonuclease/exonuclease/phosphatase domain-containing protein n=4 Tax=Candidatus Daviesiibacteriota TaxID=1752718 RepID=A0A0G0F2Q6_9BACT|nr:MAG: Endonuclease/exonuclease/phosphatase [uncultured bacterium]KKQ07910.1 MAG: hypothetical protein US19_C0035G0021 [Candidatus Daviesbacteria bacterium GW2011_GWB1_36_5]KKQ13623.1 MAG: hypothetical protein US28_C0047G0009 [Candidatus Daviesbacteria bacterium GW2011_GWA1_36_8]OGE16595.1 MAG: hypothetical protein A2858_01985 [Candidatus Daviesbacteria bacterium RIFCSPHIGHO2_01_FULL_36_37]OGE31724.1 MAG: hypothetical protein A3C99_02820 [Candidatus Daviesbacteria bacterium RIFCSPHIGHO2_02_FUL
MKLISLNIWGGHDLTPLLNFINDQSKDTDIFCFQEVINSENDGVSKEGYKYNNLVYIKNCLKNYTCYFHPSHENFLFDSPTNFPLEVGPAIFVKNIITEKNAKDLFVFRKKSEITLDNKGRSILPKNIQILKFRKNGRDYMVINLHGITFPGTKLDTAARIKQSKKTLGVLNNFNGKKILVGDFNLMPSTKSIKMLEDSGLVNLIKKYKIRKTRSNLNIYGKQRFADYTLVSKDIKVHNFNVPQNILISDHLPMILNFN